MKTDDILKKYDYSLPKELIAQKPARPRDSARLLVYGRKDGSIKFDTFKNLGKYLPKNSVLVFNQTRVIPARLWLKKDTGGKVEILYLGADAKKRGFKVLANKKLSIGSSLSLLSNRKKVIRLRVIAKQENVYLLKTDQTTGNLKKLFEKYGKTPLPPYLKNSRLNETARRKEYQTIFARTGESIAAPTASLHFTKRLMNKLARKGFSLKFINLNVNLGTFAPLKKENLAQGKLHAENYNLDKKTARFITHAKKQGRPVVAVGTTVTRALESAYKNPRALKLKGNTKLFIRPPYKFKIISALVTNFHVPKSSLMMLVATLIGRKQLLNTYQKAIKKHFRFFSFGDGMLILP